MNQPNDFLWEMLKRYDSYTENTNTRATIIVAFDTFVFSGIVLNWRAILPAQTSNDVTLYFTLGLLSVTAIAALISLWKAFRVIDLFIGSLDQSGDEQSRSFFAHTANTADIEKTIQSLQHSSEAELSKYLAQQVYSVSEALKMKFANVKAAISAIIWGQLIPLSILICINIGELILHVWSSN